MVTINLQWLAIPLALFALYLFGDGLLTWWRYHGTADIGPLIGYAALWNGSTQGLVVLVVAWLVWRAFRP